MFCFVMFVMFYVFLFCFLFLHVVIVIFSWMEDHAGKGSSADVVFLDVGTNHHGSFTLESSHTSLR